jgi:hypothetical protein
MFRLAKVKFAIMTNDPFNDDEANAWKSMDDPSQRPHSKLYRTSLSIDVIGEGNWASCTFKS